MDKFIKFVIAICCVIIVSVGAFYALTNYYRKNDRMAVLTQQINSLTIENTDLRQQLATKNNEELLYRAALEDSRTVNRIANWHTFSGIIVMLFAIGFLCFTPLLWMTWTLAYWKYYIPALNRIKADEHGQAK